MLMAEAMTAVAAKTCNNAFRWQLMLLLRLIEVPTLTQLCQRHIENSGLYIALKLPSVAHVGIHAGLLR